MTRIAVIGCGKMGEALIAGISASDSSYELALVDANDDRAKELAQKYNASAPGIRAALTESTVIIVAVKPKDLVSLSEELLSILKGDHVFVSVVAGASLEVLRELCGPEVQLVRAMPNTPAQVGKGVTGVSFSSNVRDSNRNLVLKVLGSVGSVYEIDESLQDALVAVSGSGPAYFYAFVEAVAKGGAELGLDDSLAQELAIQTIVGAAAMLEHSGDDPARLRENVTSPNGTTFAALESFSDDDLDGLVAKAQVRAATRSAALTDELFEQVSDQQR